MGPVSERPTFAQYDPEVTERWAREAEDLASALRRCEIAADPPPDSDDPRHAAWSAPGVLIVENRLKFAS